MVGLAPVAGMCTATSSCTINEGKHFESVFVVAHEIGHKYVIGFFFVQKELFFFKLITIVMIVRFWF